MIGLLSDSHGDLEAFETAYGLLRAQGAKRFFFTGGAYGDFDGWISLRKSRGPRPQSPTGSSLDDWNPDNLREQFIRTAEKDSIHGADESVQLKIMELIGDVLCCIVYDKNDLDRDDMTNASIFVHGKSPEPKVVQIGPRLFVTPGSLVGVSEPTCALIDDSQHPLLFSAFTLEGKLLVDRQLLSAGGKAKLSVK